MEQDAEKAAEEILQAWAEPCADFVRELIGKARSGLSDHEFRAELAAVLARLPEMDLTNDDLLQEALWASPRIDITDKVLKALDK